MKFLGSEFFQSRKVIVLVFVGIVFLGLTGAIASQTPFNSSLAGMALNLEDIPLVTVEQLQQAQKSQSFIFIDVRTPREYQRDRIKNSILVPINAIEEGSGADKVREIAAQNPDSTLVLYCQRGPRSYRAYRHLEKTGAKFVVLSGGISAWRKGVSE
ncbi:MAG: rhodanese-like domain-containing protein [Spirulina sp.]